LVIELSSSDARELPRREHTTFRTLRKSEVKQNLLPMFMLQFDLYCMQTTLTLTVSYLLIV
jgi:hypothetical protein